MIMIMTSVMDLFCADCYFDRSLCKLELCCNWRNRLGLGWCNMAIQHNILYPTWFPQVLHSLCFEWEGLGSCHWTKGKYTMGSLLRHLIQARSLCSLDSLTCRLHSQDKRTLGRNKGNFNGHMHKGHCMDYKHQTPNCSTSARISMNSIKWLKKQKGELKLQGTFFSFLARIF